MVTNGHVDIRFAESGHYFNITCRGLLTGSNWIYDEANRIMMKQFELWWSKSNYDEASRIMMKQVELLKEQDNKERTKKERKQYSPWAVLEIGTILRDQTKVVGLV